MTSNHSSQVLSYLFFLSFVLLMIMKCFPAQNTSTVPFDIGVVLDLNSSDERMWLNSMSIAVSDFYATHNYYKTRLVLHPKDSKNDCIGAASAALELLKYMDVKAIIGPGTSIQANFVVDLGEKAQVPIISFSATNPSLYSSRSPYFIRTSLNDSSQVRAITAIIQAFAWKEVVFITEDTDYGNGLLPYLIRAFQEVGAPVPYRSVISPLANDPEILEDLNKLKKMQATIFIVHMSYSLGSRLFLMAQAAEMMSEGYAWIVTDSMTNHLNSMDSSVIDSMQGVLGVSPYVPKSKELDTFRVKWKKKFLQENLEMERNEPSVYDLWAYDTLWALAMAAETLLISMDSPIQNPKSIDNSSDLATLRVSESEVGPKILRIIQKTQFKGLGGEFHIIDGLLQPSIFQILNVIGRGGGKIGFWTAKNGILRELSKINSNTYSTSMSNLRVIIWPGDSIIVPKGWTFLTNGRRLRIGVPVTNAFTAFVKVEWDQQRNLTSVSGYSIDVFNAVMMALPYGIQYEFIPFINPTTGMSNGSYNEMVYQVYLQNLDAAVGDITILQNRSLYVDFTLPYTETGVSMIVPIKDSEKNSWIFLKPLSTEMWLSTLAAFIFTGCVVWVFEHRINSNFRGSPSQQLGMIFWFSFSTVVYAHREKVRSNLSRLVLIVWVFVVLILTSSYTASLTSTLTVEQLTVIDVNQLIKNGENVGYQAGSYVHGILKSLNFPDTKLKALRSVDEYADALSKGSRKGGVAAIFDEIPYLKLFLSRHCDKYAMIGPNYCANGFAYVFRKGSPLVLEVSRAILNLEGDQLTKINLKWFENKTSCHDPASTESLSCLTIDSFRGLFLMTITTSTFALFLFFSSFLHKNMHILTNTTGSESNSNITQRLANLAIRFYQSEESCRTTTQLDQERQVMDPAIPSDMMACINTHDIQEDGVTSSLDDLDISSDLDSRNDIEMINTTE